MCKNVFIHIHKVNFYYTEISVTVNFKEIWHDKLRSHRDEPGILQREDFVSITWNSKTKLVFFNLSKNAWL